jgi:WD40 repeat protein
MGGGFFCRFAFVRGVIHVGYNAGGRKMKCATLLFSTFAIFSEAASGLSLDPVATIGTPISSRSSAWDGHVNFLLWNDPNTIIYAGEKGFLKCHNVSANTEVWTQRLDCKIRNIAGGVKSLFLLDDKGILIVLSAKDGIINKTLSREDIAKTVGISFVILNNMAYIHDTNQLVLCGSSNQYGSNSYILDGLNLKHIKTMDTDGFVKHVNTSPSGEHIVTLSMNNYIRIWSLLDNHEIFKLGEGKGSPIDAPFMSNSQYDGKDTLVYSIDNSWSTGTVHVYNINEKKEIASFDSRNGHLEMDVDYVNKRIALTGTTKNLVLTDFSGQLLSEVKAAAEQRIVVVKFSPDYSRLAIGSWDNTVRVFSINKLDNKNIVHEVEKPQEPYKLLSVVSQDGKYGYKRPDGTWFKEPQYECAYKFDEGVGCVKINGKWGMLKPDGTWLKEPQFYELTPLTAGIRAQTFDGESGFLNSDGEFIKTGSLGKYYKKSHQ